MNIPVYSLCVISDQYFVDFPSVRHMSNKHEARPYYLAIKQEGDIYWVIPLSSKVEKYRAKISQDEEKYGESIFYYIAKVKGNDSAFLIGNTIPVTDTYIKRSFTVKGVPFIIQDKSTIKGVQSRIKRYLAMVRRGKLKPSVDILAIETQLKK